MGKCECPVCGSEIDIPKGTEEGEILTCDDCSSELEVRGLDPLKLDVAPEEEEDWGE